MSTTARVRAWFAERPAATDTVVAMLTALAGLAPFLVGPDQQDVRDLRLSTLLLTGLSCALLMLRRRHPVAVWAAATAIGVAGVLVEGGASPAYAPAIVALYTVASTNPLRLTLGAAVVTAVSPAAIIAGRPESNVVDAFAYGLTAWSFLAAATGIAVRNQRAVVAAAQERARQAEATREEEAQRRVTEERLRIARELHDVVAHHISVINVQAGVASHLVRSDPDQAVEALAHVREASQVVLREVPGLLGLLRTVDDELDRQPAPALAEAEELITAARRSGLDVTWRTSGSPAPLSPGAELAAYRVLQEALTNATRHGTGRATATLSQDPTGCTLEVRNERSADSGTAAPDRHGLVGMRERVAAVGGELSVGPDGDRGWVVRARLPVRAGAEVEAS